MSRLFGRHARQVLAVDDDPPGVRPVEAGDEAQRGRLAAAGRAEQRDELALLEREVDARAARRPCPKARCRPWSSRYAIQRDLRGPDAHRFAAAPPPDRASSESIAAQVIAKLISVTAAAGYACVSLMYWM